MEEPETVTSPHVTEEDGHDNLEEQVAVLDEKHSNPSSSENVTGEGLYVDSNNEGALERTPSSEEEIESVTSETSEDRAWTMPEPASAANTGSSPSPKKEGPPLPPAFALVGKLPPSPTKKNKTRGPPPPPVNKIPGLRDLDEPSEGIATSVEPDTTQSNNVVYESVDGNVPSDETNERETILDDVNQTMLPEALAASADVSRRGDNDEVTNEVESPPDSKIDLENTNDEVTQMESAIDEAVVEEQLEAKTPDMSTGFPADLGKPAVAEVELNDPPPPQEESDEEDLISLDGETQEENPLTSETRVDVPAPASVNDSLPEVKSASGEDDVAAALAPELMVESVVNDDVIHSVTDFATTEHAPSGEAFASEQITTEPAEPADHEPSPVTPEALSSGASDEIAESEGELPASKRTPAKADSFSSAAESPQVMASEVAAPTERTVVTEAVSQVFDDERASEEPQPISVEDVLHPPRESEEHEPIAVQKGGEPLPEAGEGEQLISEEGGEQETLALEVGEQEPELGEVVTVISEEVGEQENLTVEEVGEQEPEPGEQGTVMSEEIGEQETLTVGEIGEQEPEVGEQVPIIEAEAGKQETLGVDLIGEPKPEEDGLVIEGALQQETSNLKAAEEQTPENGEPLPTVAEESGEPELAPGAHGPIIVAEAGETQAIFPEVGPGIADEEREETASEHAEEPQSEPIMVKDVIDSEPQGTGEDDTQVPKLTPSVNEAEVVVPFSSGPSSSLQESKPTEEIQQQVAPEMDSPSKASGRDELHKIPIPPLFMGSHEAEQSSPSSSPGKPAPDVPHKIHIPPAFSSGQSNDAKEDLEQESSQTSQGTDINARKKVAIPAAFGGSDLHDHNHGIAPEDEIDEILTPQQAEGKRKVKIPVAFIDSAPSNTSDGRSRETIENVELAVPPVTETTDAEIAHPHIHAAGAAAIPPEPSTPKRFASEVSAPSDEGEEKVARTASPITMNLSPRKLAIPAVFNQKRADNTPTREVPSPKRPVSMSPSAHSRARDEEMERRESEKQREMEGQRERELAKQREIEEEEKRKIIEEIARIEAQMAAAKARAAEEALRAEEEARQKADEEAKANAAAEAARAEEEARRKAEDDAIEAAKRVEIEAASHSVVVEAPEDEVMRAPEGNEEGKIVAQRNDLQVDVQEEGNVISDETKVPQRTELDPARVLDQIETTPANTPPTTPSPEKKEPDGTEMQAQHDASNLCGCLIL